MTVFQVNVGHPSEVDEIFDAISYSKGASVIRMLHNYIGDKVGCPARPIFSLRSSGFKYFSHFVGLQERNELVPFKVPTQKRVYR